MKRDVGQEKVVVSVVLEPEMIRQLDERAKGLDLNRSQYLRRLVREEMIKNPLPDKQLELTEVAA